MSGAILQVRCHLFKNKTATDFTDREPICADRSLIRLICGWILKLGAICCVERLAGKESSLLIRVICCYFEAERLAVLGRTCYQFSQENLFKSFSK